MLEHDVLIVGAGLAGIVGIFRRPKQLPGKMRNNAAFMKSLACRGWKLVIPGGEPDHGTNSTVNDFFKVIDLVQIPCSKSLIAVFRIKSNDATLPGSFFYRRFAGLTHTIARKQEYAQ